MPESLPTIDEMQDILDLKEVLVWDITWILLITGVVLVLVILLLLWRYWRKKRLAKPKEGPPPTPIEKAMARLNQLMEAKLVERGKVRNFYFNLSEIFRDFLEEEMNISANEATLEELKPLLKQAPDFTGGELKEIYWFLEVSDMAKFAKLVPENKEIQRSVETSRSIMTTLAQRRHIPEATETDEENSIQRVGSR